MSGKKFTSCPKCQSEIRLINFGTLQIEHCPNCSGFFMDPHEYRDPQTHIFENPSPVRSPEGAVLDKLHIRCPKCRVEMRKRRPRTPDAPLLDICPQCKGIWFDEGEFRRDYSRWKKAVKPTAIIHLNLVCLDCSVVMNEKFFLEKNNMAWPKCPRCGQGMSFETAGVVEVPDTSRYVYIPALIIFFVMVGLILNYFREFDHREINPQQPVAINEQIYGGKIRLRVVNPDKAFSLGTYRTYGPMVVETASMVNADYTVVLKDVSEKALMLEYEYLDEQGAEKAAGISLPLSGRRAVLKIPPVPLLEKDRGKTLILEVAEGGKSVHVTEAGE